MTWSIEGSLSPACVRERVKSLPHASCLKFKRWPLKEEASSCTRSETASKLLDMDQSYGGWPALQHPPNFRNCNIEMGSKKRSKTSPSSSQSWQTTKCVANKRPDLLLYEVAWLHDVSRAQAHACKSGAKVARFRAPDSTSVRRSSVMFFLLLLLHAYTTSDLRTFRRTCVHVRKESSLEISVNGQKVTKVGQKRGFLGACGNDTLFLCWFFALGNIPHL